MLGSAVFRTGIAPGGALAGPWVRDPLWTRARAVPSLDLRFADNKSLVDAVTGASLVTFTRASIGTYVGSDGVLRSAVTNLVLRSEEFDTTWARTSVSGFGVGSAVNVETAPNGTLTADLIAVANGINSGSGFVFQDITKAATSTTYTVTTFAKAQDWNAVTLHAHDVATNNNRATVTFSLATGVITTAAAAVGTFSAASAITATPFINGWFRVNLTFTSSTETGLRVCLIPNNSTTVTSDGTNGIYLWGAQLEQSATVGEYISTTSTINSAPRFDHNPTTGESLGLLVEEARTNLLLRSEEFDAANWPTTRLLAFGSGSTVNAIASPNGQITADLLTESTTTGTHQVQQTASVTIGQVYAYSVFCKLGPNAVRRIQLQVPNTNFTVTPNATFDLTTGTVVSVAQGTASITSYANGWYRLVLNTIAATSTGANGFQFRFVDTGTNSSYTGDGSAGLYLWGADLQAGAFATSYIPTTSATVTRAADVASITGTNFSSWYNQTEGTVFSDSNIIASQVQTQTVWQLGGGTILTSLRQPQGTSNQFRALIGGTFTASPGTGGLLSAGTSKAGVTYLGTAGRLQVASSGVDSTGSSLDANKLDIGSLNPGTSLNGTIKRLVYWGQRLPNNVLQAITQ